VDGQEIIFLHQPLYSFKVDYPTFAPHCFRRAAVSLVPPMLQTAASVVRG